MSSLNKSSNKEDDNDMAPPQFVQFPEVVDDRIDTIHFLTASRGVVKLIDKFGKLFAPVKYDMQGNIEKLNTRFVGDKEVNRTLQGMILMEITIGDSMVATEALLWLTRGLHMIQAFFEKIVDECKTGKGTEDLVALLKKAYEESLEPYHNWMAKQLFGLLSRMVPCRTHLLQMLANDIPGKEDVTLDAMDRFTRGLKNNVMAVHAFYAENGLNYRRNIIATGR